MADRVAIVTGGGTGIGAAVARLLAERGTTIVLVGRRAEKLDEVAGEIAATGSKALTVTADLAEPSAPRAIVDKVLAELDRIDVLVNNAGTASIRPLEQVTVEEFDEHVAVNLRSALFLIQAALPALRRSPAPAVVNVSSAAASLYRTGQSVYGSTKAALEYMTKSLAAELAPEGIRVNAVAPGPTDTPLHASYTDDVASAYKYLSRMVPLGRMGRAEEVAWWVAELAEPQAAWVTGAVIPVDGGRTLGPPATS